MEKFYFRKLDVYQNAKRLVVDIYGILDKFPSDEKYGLCSQIKRATTSIPINIAEGFGRFSSKEKVHFMEIAYGSLTETLCELELAVALGYINEKEYDIMEEQIIIVAKQLSKLRSSVIKNANNP